MANQHRGEARVKIGQKTYTMTASFGDLAEIEDAIDTGIIDLFQRGRLGKLLTKEMIAIIRVIAKDNDQDPPEQEIIARWMASKGMAEPHSVVTDFLLKAVSGGLSAGNVSAAAGKTK